MRVAKVETIKNSTDKIKHLKLDKPIIIPRIPVLTNEKQRDKCIKSIEKYVRTSMEYRDFIKYLKDNMDMNQCEFFSNIDGKKKNNFIQIHHEPFDLYTLVNIVMHKYEKKYNCVDELEIADEVLYLHYIGQVGLIPLSVTAHELVHDGKLIVPLNCVYGNFVEFTKEYYDIIMEVDENIIDMLKQKVELSKKLVRDDMNILNVKYVYTDVDGFSLPQLIEDETETRTAIAV